MLDPLVGEPEVGYWLAALEDARRRTLRELGTVRPVMLDRPVDGPLPTIGSLLYHIALIEASWLLTGESRRYSPTSAAFQAPKPRIPFVGRGGWGAWELAARFSQLDLNSGIVNGGRMEYV